MTATIAPGRPDCAVAPRERTHALSQSAHAPSSAARCTGAVPRPRLIRRRPRRGAALLLVLAFLAVVMVAAVGLAAAKLAFVVERDDARLDDVASSLVDGLDAPLIRWVEAVAPTVTLPPDAAVPAVLVMALSMTVDGVPVVVDVVGFDHRGMVPWRHAAAGGSLKSALPQAIIDALDGAAPVGGGQFGRDRLGLDQIGHDQIGAAPTITRFPARRALGLDTDGAEVLTVGGSVSTHADRVARINVNTAPAALLVEAFRAAGLAGAEQALARRAEGRSAIAPQQGSSRRVDDVQGRDVLLVDRSQLWSFRIDVQVGAIRRSEWIVIGPTDDGIRRLQRIRIDG